MNELIERCPFCGAKPKVYPLNSKKDGNAWGAVTCINADCPAQPSVKDGEEVADERGSDAYKQAAIARWNRRALSSPTPGGVVKPTEDAVERAAKALAGNDWNWPESEGRAEMRATYREDARRALEAASSPSPGEPVDVDIIGLAASKICEVGALCGWPSPECKSREAAEALFAAGLLRGPLYASPPTSPPEPPQGVLDGARPLPFDRDTLGRMVREAWVRWAKTQPAPKPSWLLPYDEIAEPDKEADRQIGEAIDRWTLIGDSAAIANAERSPLPLGGWTQALLDIAAERQRQVTEEGWTPEHDDKHTGGELAAAAANYALYHTAYGYDLPNHIWPWEPQWWKAKGPPPRPRAIRRTAEIERLDRSPSPSGDA